MLEHQTVSLHNFLNSAFITDRLKSHPYALITDKVSVIMIALKTGKNCCKVALLSFSIETSQQIDPQNFLDQSLTSFGWLICINSWQIHRASIHDFILISDFDKHETLLVGLFRKFLL